MTTAGTTTKAARERASGTAEKQASTRQPQAQQETIADMNLVQAQKQVGHKHDTEATKGQPHNLERTSPDTSNGQALKFASTAPVNPVPPRCSPGAGPAQPQYSTVLSAQAQPRKNLGATLVPSRSPPPCRAPVQDWCSPGTIAGHRPGTASVQFTSAHTIQLRYNSGAGPERPNHNTGTAPV